MKRFSRFAHTAAAFALLHFCARFAAAQTKTSPNAYDFYLRAANALDYRDQGKDFPNFDNANLNAPFASSWKRREAVLRHNQRALQLMRQGFEYSYLQPVLAQNSSEFGDSRLFPFLSKARQLARLLGVEADVYASRGQYDKALSSGIDAVRLGTDLPRGGALISLLVGVAVESIGNCDLKKSYIEKLDAKQVKNLAQRLEKLDTYRVSYVQTLQNEKVDGLRELAQIFKNAKWRRQFHTRRTPAQITATYNRLMSQVIANAALTYPQRRGVVAKNVDEVNGTIIGLYLSDDASKPSYAASGIFVERSRARSRLTATMLALRAFKIEHGKYPATLHELAPNYLKSAPVDPFSDGKPLRYKSAGVEYSLYSIGPDAKDDGGKPGKSHFRPDDTGDIVAGID